MKRGMPRRTAELVEMHRGELRIARSGLWLDARRRAPCAFVSHAHGDHIGRHDRTIATAPTLALMEHRLGKPTRGERLPVGYRQPFGMGDLTVELLPAGHVLGSAQIRVSRDGRSVGYSGDLCLEPTLTAEPAEVLECDALVLESTFGDPRYVFPPKEEVLGRIRRFVDDALSDGVTPVLFGYALGKAQEILGHLGRAGYRCRAHPMICAVNRVYRACGVELPEVPPLGPGAPAPGEVVVAPPHLARSAAVLRIPRRRTAVLTGWAIEGGRFRYRGMDAAFPLSDHADFPSLLGYARASGARRVFTVHGHAEELARALRRERIRAEPLAERRQLELL
jgi:putative mRNA 3-end processing factor